VDDARRAAVFAKLKRTLGLDPAKILATPLPALANIIEDGGMLAATRVRSPAAVAGITGTAN
jgi:hypothetical protein